MSRFAYDFAGFILGAALTATPVCAVISNYFSPVYATRGVTYGSVSRVLKPSETRAPKALSRPGTPVLHTGGKPAAMVGASGFASIRSEDSIPQTANERRRNGGVILPPGGLERRDQTSSQTASPGPQKVSACDSWNRNKCSQGVRSVPSAEATRSYLRAAEGSSLKAMATTAARRCRVDPALFLRLVRRESDWNPAAVSSSGARGLAQLIPRYHSHPLLEIDDPQTNLSLGACYLRAQHDRFGSWSKALRAYHGGPSALDTGTVSEASVRYAAQISKGTK